MNFFTYVFGKGYTGGPDFSRLESFRFDLEGIGLTLSVPASNIALPWGEININLPFRSPGWFDAHCEQQANHFHVKVFGDVWAYIGPLWRAGPDRTFGVLNVRVAIKRTLPGKVLDVNNLDTLAEAIRWDYEWYFEVEEPGKYGRGHNREARREAEEEYEARHPSIPEEKKLRDKTLSLAHSLRELPTHFEPRRYGDQEWLYYALKRESNTSAHYYCQPLDEHYYLCVRFGYGIDFRQYFHLWQADAETAEQRIIETVKLSFPNRLPAPEEKAADRLRESGAHS
jgi:hypothetical protein